MIDTSANLVAAGDHVILWSTLHLRGYMVFVGISEPEPAAELYWVWDGLAWVPNTWPSVCGPLRDSDSDPTYPCPLEPPTADWGIEACSTDSGDSIRTQPFSGADDESSTHSMDSVTNSDRTLPFATHPSMPADENLHRCPCCWQQNCSQVFTTIDEGTCDHCAYNCLIRCYIHMDLSPPNELPPQL